MFGDDWPWPSRSTLTSNSKFTPFWACPCHNSCQSKLQFPNLEQNASQHCVDPYQFWAWLKLIYNQIFNFKPRPNWHHWHSLVRPANLKVGRIEGILREWTNSKNSHWNSSLALTVSQCECFTVGSYWVCHWKKTFWVGGCDDGIGGLAYLLFCAAYWCRQSRVFRRLSRSRFIRKWKYQIVSLYIEYFLTMFIWVFVSS